MLYCLKAFTEWNTEFGAEPMYCRIHARFSDFFGGSCWQGVGKVLGPVKSYSLPTEDMCKICYDRDIDVVRALASWFLTGLWCGSSQRLTESYKSIWYPTGVRNPNHNSRTNDTRSMAGNRKGSYAKTELFFLSGSILKKTTDNVREHAKIVASRQCFSEAANAIQTTIGTRTRETHQVSNDCFRWREFAKERVGELLVPRKSDWIVTLLGHSELSNTLGGAAPSAPHFTMCRSGHRVDKVEYKTEMRPDSFLKICM